MAPIHCFPIGHSQQYAGRRVDHRDPCGHVDCQQPVTHGRQQLLRIALQSINFQKLFFQLLTVGNYFVDHDIKICGQNLYLITGDKEVARKTFADIYGVNSNYRDVVAKLEELKVT